MLVEYVDIFDILVPQFRLVYLKKANEVYDMQRRGQAWQSLGDMSRESAMAEFMKMPDRLCPLLNRSSKHIGQNMTKSGTNKFKFIFQQYIQ